MRSENSKKSAITSLLSNGIKILLSFFSQRLFVIYIGTKFLGLNGLFSNIVSMLAISELGIGSAIIYNLYEPIAKNDKKKIKQLVDFYKKSYLIISLIILIISLSISPFVPYFANNDVNNIYIYYFLFISDMLMSYSVAYKTSLINAYQKNYIVNVIHIFYLIIMNLLQILLIFVFKSYLLFLIVKIVSRLIENIMISLAYNKIFDWIHEIESSKLSKDTKNDIVSKVKALMMHKMANFLVAGTDNIIISKLFGLITVGLYSNYCMVINSIQTLFQQVFDSIVSSIGNLLVEKNSEKSFNIYKMLSVINFFIISFCSLCLYYMIEPFISLWLGKDFLFNNTILFMLILVFYSTGMRNPSNSFKNAAGIFVEDRFIPLIESFINLISSILLGLKFGLIGVFMGTFLSSLLLHFYSFPKFVYGKIFKKNGYNYILLQIKFFCIFILEFIISYFVFIYINVNNVLFTLIIRFVICCIIPNAVNFIIFRKTDEFKLLLTKFKFK